MSQLIDKLNRVAKTVPQSMGFKAYQSAAPKAQMILIASFAQTAHADSLVDCATSADAILLSIAKPRRGAKTTEETAQSLPDIPWGVWLGDMGEKELGNLAKAGGDFVGFSSADKVIAFPEDNKIGKILQVGSSLNEDLLKAINELPVDAVLVVGESKGPLTWHQLMLIQRLSNLLTKPLLASAQPNIAASEPKFLWEAGADGVVVEVSTGQPLGKLKKLRQAIDSLSSLPPRKRGKPSALLPHIDKETGTVTDTEEEEEED